MVSNERTGTVHVTCAAYSRMPTVVLFVERCRSTVKYVPVPCTYVQFRFNDALRACVCVLRKEVNYCYTGCERGPSAAAQTNV